MPDIELFDETLDINATQNYEISIQVGPDGFSFALLDTIREKIVFLRSYEPDDYKGFSQEEISGILIKDDFLNRQYKRVIIVFPSRKSVLVPSALFDPAKREAYFCFSHTNEDQDEILVNRIKQPESYLLYSVNRVIAETFQSKFPGAESISHLKSLLHYSMVSGKGGHEAHIHLHIEKGFFNLLYVKGMRVEFCNSFTFKNVNDIMYYLFYIYELLGINQETALVLSGRSDHYEELHANIANYSKGVRYASAPAGSFFSYAIEELPLHRYLNLFNAFHCA